VFASVARILLIDDDIELSRMLTQYLGGEGFIVTTAENSEAGVDEAISGGYEAVLLDVMMPRLNGIEALRRIRRVSNVPVIMLTARGDGLDRVAGLESGADDYISKPYYSLELVARLRAVLRRLPRTIHEQPIGELERGSLRLVPAQRRAYVRGCELLLTATEFNILEALLNGFDKVVTKDELSLQGLGRRRELYDRSVDVHVSNIRQKLTSAGADDVQIETVRGVGYRMQAP
jgi:two-component system, OmpR family, response regulator